MTYIYALIDPKTNEVRYVGKANNPEQRYYHHCQAKSNNHSSCWIRKIRPNLPEMIILENVSNIKSIWQESERFWISYFKFLGARLTNLTRGGDGGATRIGYKNSLESRRKISIALKGREHKPHSEQFKIRMSKKNQGDANPMFGVSRFGSDNPMFGKTHSDDAKNKMKNAKAGFPLTKDHIAKIAIKSKGASNPRSKLTEKEILKIREDPRKNCDIAKDYPVSRATIGKIKSKKLWSHL